MKSCILFTDASDEDYGGFILKHLNKEICSAKFQDSEKATSSTFIELLAVKYVHTSFGELVKNQSVQVNVDNSSACRILSVGSSKPHLQRVAIDVFTICTKLNIKLIPKWIPREENHLADFYSRMNDTDNWSIDDETFKFVEGKFGSFSVDRFANNLNRKTNIFNSKFYCPGTSHVNAFTDDWGGSGKNWLCPPISCLGSVWRHLKLCKAKGTLLLPIWPSSYFWPLIYPNGKNLANFIKDYIVIEPFYTAEVCGSVFNGYPKFKTLVLDINCSE